MKARIWFEAQGQSMRARGFNWHEAKVLIRLYSLPAFARRAFAHGHLNGARSFAGEDRDYPLQHKESDRA